MRETLLLLVLTLAGTFALDNGVALTPPKGWRSWERFRCNTDCDNDPQNCISSQLFEVMADRMIEEKFVLDYDPESSWDYIMLDDCWSDLKRDDDGKLRTSYSFGGRIQELADYMHARKIKLGLHLDLGPRTCNGYPGSKGYFEQDAQTLAEWGVDMVHLDACTANVDDLDTDFPAMSNYLNKTGRPMYISCGWPKYLLRKGIQPDYRKIAKYCNSWRVYEDVEDSWLSVTKAFDYYGNNTGHFNEIAGPGAWNDMGTVVGDYGLSYDEQRVQMALWSMMSVPLFMSTDLRKLSTQSKDLLQNYWLEDLGGYYGNRPGYRFRKVRTEILISKYSA
ncbi:hypothetical protein FSP39_011005 [Pinctada imbricata]|uniref:Alpha-galactosidase n=1 Tax=Pinctada imbricata TaxID=66713 RepID=A0AA88XWA8_PINIB|nr:hypothetical protein FSP39_011005 [Pinctada imbricata]